MKTIIKNKRSYRSKIGRLELPDHSGSTSERTGAASGGARSNEASDGEGPGEFSNSDEGASNKEDSASNKEDSASNKEDSADRPSECLPVQCTTQKKRRKRWDGGFGVKRCTTKGK